MAKSMIDRNWIASEILKIVEAERSLATEAKARTESPSMSALAVLYHEIADQEERHIVALETIATRYGHTPMRAAEGGVGETLVRFKDKVATLGDGPTELLRQDLSARADAIHWQSAWGTFSRLSVMMRARDLTALLAEDHAHHAALLEGLKRLLEQETHGHEGS